MNFILAALAVALVGRSYVHLAAWSLVPRDSSDTVLHVLCVVLAVPAHWAFHISIWSCLGVAFLADAMLQVRELLVLLTDLCKTAVLVRAQQRRTR